MALIGPCVVAAPVVGVLAIVALPLWPVAIILVGACRLLTWPLIRMASGAAWARTLDARLVRAFRFVLRPWSFFDPPHER